MESLFFSPAHVLNYFFRRHLSRRLRGLVSSPVIRFHRRNDSLCSQEKLLHLRLRFCDNEVRMIKVETVYLRRIREDMCAG
ncbi:hypothetical protein IGI04_021447 [Brassica rapa subsp. trilocularis]|uniref:Uncharacterized protein n=1 Tax=Brassica rapa subsp. trilocularis TaxID=1813537 RepID=A0ABQ7M1I3_BRACM|nr:hypothetical protein IGI04_021447 [Brassica rapa subsp. trilocularis]